ncbi:MAG: cytochrome c biogenesis protein CcdA [Chloroflexota bacterium]|nr:cytochrome c biogenesis protein CcdA [Chloroflexota bacterium]
MGTQNLTLALATLFGLVSFLSPCVLPLVPVYLGYLTGATIAGADEEGHVSRWFTFSHAVVLVLGFTVVFVALGALGGAVGQALNRAIPSIVRVGGVMLVVFGLRVAHIHWPKLRWVIAALLMGLFAFVVNSRETVPNRVLQAVMFGSVTLAGYSWSLAGHVAIGGVAALLNFLSIWQGTPELLGNPNIGGFTATIPAVAESALIWLLVAWASRTDLFYMERRIELDQDRNPGYVTSFFTGVVFGAGWTPCVGPILASILALAATEQSIGRGALLLLFYSIGLGIPFLMAGLLFNQLSQWLPKINRYLPTISLISGLLLAVVGVVIYTGGLQLSASLLPQVELESWLLGILGQGE